VSDAVRLLIDAFLSRDKPAALSQLLSMSSPTPPKHASRRIVRVNRPTTKAKEAQTTDSSSSGFPTTLATVIAVVVAALAAVGLTGQPLLRAMRNNPRGIAAIFAIAALGALLFLLGQLATTDGASGNNLKYGGVVIITIAIIFAVAAGATASKRRELPLVTLQAAPVALPSGAPTGEFGSGMTEVTVRARAVNLTTDNNLLVQVIGLYKDPQGMEDLPTPAPVPSPSRSQAIPYAAVEICENNHTFYNGTRLDSNKGKLLLWDRIGPKDDGTVDATWKIKIPTDTYTYVCAWAPVGGINRPINSAAYLRLKQEPTQSPPVGSKPPAGSGTPGSNTRSIH
jgi:hypothetical protein